MLENVTKGVVLSPHIYLLKIQISAYEWPDHIGAAIVLESLV